MKRRVLSGWSVNRLADHSFNLFVGLRYLEFQAFTAPREETWHKGSGKELTPPRVSLWGCSTNGSASVGD